NVKTRRTRSAERPLAGIDPGSRCFEQIKVGSESVTLRRRAGHRPETCHLALVLADGSRLPADRIVDVVGAPRNAPQPSSLPASLGGAGTYPGTVARLKVVLGASGHTKTVTVDAWIFSDCGFVAERDCWDVPTGTRIPPFPKPVPHDVACKAAQASEMDQR